MNKYKELPLYQFVFDSEAEYEGMNCLSFVGNAANEKDFLKLSSIKMNLSFDDEKQIATGCALRADYPIYREDEDGYPFYIQFSADVIEKLVLKFMKEGRQNLINLEHSEKRFVDDVYLFESFLLSNEHKLSHPNFSDLANGSWMVSYKCDNDKVWELTKKGVLNGFSPELQGNLFNSLLQNEQMELFQAIQ